MRTILEGKISSRKEHEKELILGLKNRISSLESKIKTLEKKKVDPRILHEKKRRCATLKARLKHKEKNLQLGKLSLCFGTRKLFREQFDLKANNYASHQEWKKEWDEARSSNFFLIGSKDETAGNQSCVATLEEDGSLTLRLRLPNALLGYGKYLVVKGIRFAYGQETILAALQSSTPVALCYRFVRDRKSWKVFVTVPLSKPVEISREGIGAIGVDINANHLAVVETDRYGNPVARKVYPLCTYGKSRDQASALIGERAKEVIDWCRRAKKPLVVEKLCFAEKKCELREIGNAKYARMLSSFSYNSIISMMKSQAFRLGIQVNEVNPAYTSVIGRVKFAQRYGFSIHESAALTIGRRFLRNSERLPRHQSKVPDGKGGYVTLPLPARNRGRHVWSSWRQVRKRLLKWCLQHVSRREKAILKSDHLACCDSKFLDPVGEIPTHESITQLLGGRVWNGCHESF